GTEFIFKTDDIRSDFAEAITKLPYIFKDPHKLDKKIDLKKLRFGSRIDGSSAEREEYYSVAEVIDTQTLRLGNGLIVRLIGVKQKQASNGMAVDFLVKKTKGQKIYLKFDNQKYDDENRLLCYVYLKNKTFLNAHLIREGLADVDRALDFKYRDKFIKLGAENG
ncbi:MAG: thermonuclease family protein, partial [Syntrophales bacterium]|nr:thermonuclease family protein [Syntrophales bacterium]